MSNRLPPMYHCIVCGLALRPSDQTSVRLAIVWLKSKGTTISKVSEELHQYKHEFCNEKNVNAPIQDALF